MFVILISSAAVTLTACEPPSSTYRRSTLRPALLATQTPVPVAEGKLQVSGAVAGRSTATVTPELGDPGMHVATTGVAAEVQRGLSEHVMLGGQVSLSHAAWTSPSADGTPPLGDAERSVIGFTPSVTLHTGVKPGLFGALRLDATVLSVPWATWELEPGEAERCPPCEDGPPRYKAVDQGTEGVLLYGAALSGGYRFGDILTAFAGFSAQNTIKNIGFSDEQQDGSTITADVWVWTPSMGVQARLGERLLLQAQLTWPVTQDDLPSGPGYMGTVGFEL